MRQLMSGVIARVNKMLREQSVGHVKVSQSPHCVNLGLCIFQGFLLAASMENPTSNPFLQGIGNSIAKFGPLVPDGGIGFQIIAVITLSAGTMFLMWIGDQITERGVGNGTSMIITVGIMGSVPGAIVQVWNTFVPPSGTPSQVSPI